MASHTYQISENFNTIVAEPLSPKYTTQKQSILQFIEQEIASLPENWDGYSASAIEKMVLKNLDFLIHKLPNNLVNHLDKDHILPNSNGTVSIEWVNDKNELLLEIGNNYATYYLKNKGKVTKINNQFILSDEIAFRQFVKDLKFI